MKLLLHLQTTYYLVIISAVTSHASPQITINSNNEDSSQVSSISSLGCGPPPLVIENGEIQDENGNRDIYPLGSSVTYKCKEGFTLIGHGFPRLYCSPSSDFTGKWTWKTFLRTVIKCHRLGRVESGKDIGNSSPYKSCSTPPYSQNSIIKDNRYDYAPFATVFYMCQKGYTIVGMQVLTCMPNGEWSPSVAPACLSDVITTTQPPPPPPPSKVDSSTIMQIILYISIPLLLMFVVALVCNVRRKHLKNRRTREQVRMSSNAGRNNETRQLNERANQDAVTYRHQQNSISTVPLVFPVSYLNTSDDYTEIPSAPGEERAELKEEPPSYEEATRESYPPSFELAQELSNSVSNICETSGNEISFTS